MNTRRNFITDTGMGMTGMALSWMMFRDGQAAETAWSPPEGKPHLPPRAKSVIWIFNIGGVSHMESFDPKPMLTKYGGISIDETPFAHITDKEKIDRILLDPKKQERKVFKKILPLQNRLQTLRRKRHHGERLVSPHGRCSRRADHRTRHVDDRQQPRGAAHFSHRPQSDRRRVSDRRGLGQLRSGNNESKPAGLCRFGKPKARIVAGRLLPTDPPISGRSTPESE